MPSAVEVQLGNCQCPAYRANSDVIVTVPSAGPAGFALTRRMSRPGVRFSSHGRSPGPGPGQHWHRQVCLTHIWRPGPSTVSRSSTRTNRASTVPARGQGEEQLLLPDAYFPEALPDGSLLVVKANAEQSLQVFRFWPDRSDSARLQGLPVEVGSAPAGMINHGRLRISKDRKEAFAVCRRLGDADKALHLYRIDLNSGAMHRVQTGLSQDDLAITTLAPGNEPDTILDFNGAEGDRIDLSMLDADWASTGRQDFSFIGSASFTAAGQVRYDAAAGVLYASVDADSAAEITIQLVGNPAFTAEYLIA